MIEYEGTHYTDENDVLLVVRDLRKQGLLQEAKKVLATAIAKWPRNILLYNQLLSCTESGDAAWSIFQNIRHVKAVATNATYNALINILDRAGQTDRAWDVFKRMQKKNVAPSDVTYSTLFQVLGNSGQIDRAWSIYIKMRKEHSPVTPAAYNTLINILGVAGRTERAWTVFEKMRKDNITADVITYSTLLGILTNAGQADRAWYLFEIIKTEPIRSASVYNSIINILGRAGQIDRAWMVFEEMHCRLVKIDVVTYNILINILGKTGQTEKAWSIFKELQEKEIIADVITYTTIIDILGKAGQVDCAWDVFEEMKKNDVVVTDIAYNALISVFYNAGRQKEIVEKLDPNNLPIDVLSMYCDALRKCKQYKNSVEWCDYILLNSDDEKSIEHANIIKLYCYLHSDKLKFHECMSSFSIARTSPRYPRYLAVKVFGKAYKLEEIDEIKMALEKALTEERNESSKKDIQNALDLII